MPPRSIKNRKEGRDPYIKRRYEFLGLIMSQGDEVDQTSPVEFLSNALNLPKNQVYNHINLLAKEGKLLKNEKEGKIFISLPDVIRQEMIDRALIIFDEVGKKMTRDYMDNKKKRAAEMYLFCRDKLPQIIGNIEETLKAQIPEPYISKELIEILTDNLSQYLHEEWVKSTLF